MSENKILEDEIVELKKNIFEFVEWVAKNDFRFYEDKQKWMNFGPFSFTSEELYDRFLTQKK